MHTDTRSAEMCWLNLLRIAWRLSFEGIQYAQSIEGIQHARVIVSWICIRLVRTFSLRCPLHYFFFYKLKNSSLRCSFCFHVDSSRATPHTNTESPLSASRGIRSTRIAITVPCQQHQQESLVMPLSCNCKKKCLVTMLSYTEVYFLRCQHQYAYFG